MGIIQHHAILATTSSKEDAFDFTEWLETNFTPSHKGQEIARIGPSPTNGYYTFLIPPDGSKEGWAESASGDAIRSKILGKLHSYQNEDESNPWDFVEVNYGELGIGVSSRC